MAGAFTTGGGNTTVKFEWTKPTATMQAVIGSAAHYLVPDDITFAGLTNQQKLDIVDANVKQHILNMAKTYDIQTAAKSATDSAVATAGTNVIL